MKIAISTLVTPARKSGIGNYVVNLLNALQLVDEQNDYYVFVGQDTRHLFTWSASNFHPMYLPFNHDPRWVMRPLYYVWQNSAIYLSLKRHRIDVLHLPNLTPFLMRYVPTVVTIPDVAEFLVPRYSTLRQSYRKAVSSLVVRNSDVVITISDSAKEDIVRATNCLPEKIAVTHLASGIAKPMQNPARSVYSAYGIEGRYILYVGSALPHKNLKRVLEAFALLQSTQGITHQLVLAGVHGDGVASLLSLADELDVNQSVVLTGYVPDDDLPALYGGADLFLFPSLYEGFGLPVLEAMTCGVPVVTSNVSSLPEIAGDAALLVDPRDSEAIAEAAWRVLKDAALREEMILKGKERAAKFTWQHCAQQTLTCYRQALQNAGEQM